jgi:prophage regulatory protein
MQIFRMEAVKAATGHKSHASIYNAIRCGLFTRPVPIGSRAVGWPDYEVKAICQARIAGWLDSDIQMLVSELHTKRKQIQVL